jgi:hypothetical protein
MANLTQVATATVTSQNIGAGLVQVLSSTLTGGANIEAIATLQISNRGGGATANIRLKATVGGRLLADNLVEYIGTATASMEIQTLPFRWANGEALAISISSSDAADSAVNVTTIVDSSDGGSGGGASAEEIADAVWDEQYSQHTAAGTFGKLFDIWRKSNPAIDGVVTASVTPTTTTFSTNITGYPSGAFIHSVLLFVNGSTNAESNSPIVGYVSANGVIALEEPMQQAVQVGDEFVIAANSHVHPIASIAAGIWNSLLATYQAVGSFGKAVADTKADTTAILASAGVNVLPAVGISASRAPGVFLSPFVGELISQSITVYASDGTTPIDLSGKTLEIVFEARGGGDIAVIADGDIAIGGDDDNVVTFAYPSAVTAQERTLRFSLRDAGTPFTVYLTGLCKVSIAPSNDPA